MHSTSEDLSACYVVPGRLEAPSAPGPRGQGSLTRGQGVRQRGRRKGLGWRAGGWESAGAPPPGTRQWGGWEEMEGRQDERLSPGGTGADAKSHVRV